MSYQPVSFDNAEVLRVPVGNQVLYQACGVAVVNFAATGNDWHRDDLTFLVPEEGGAAPLNVGNFADSTVMLTLARSRATTAVTTLDGAWTPPIPFWMEPTTSG